MSEWQPIETAPIEPFDKDHWYKAHSKTLLLSDARYNSVYMGNYNFTQKGKGRFLDVMGYVKQPTHWMHLPLPPTETPNHVIPQMEGMLDMVNALTIKGDKA